MIQEAKYNAARRPLVLCPLEIERQALVRAGVDRLCELICCGPGVGGIERWAEVASVIDRPILLVGLAGALVESLQVGTTCLVVEVRDVDTGDRYIPNAALGWPKFHARHRATVTSAPQTAVSAAAKRDLYERTGTDLVDLESVAFAKAATQAKWNWAIVRVVSDAANDSLPAGIDSWVDHAGRTQLATVFKSLLRRPWLLPSLMRLSRDCDRALQALAIGLNQILAPQICNGNVQF